MVNSETRNCQNCKKDFVIEPDDFTFYEKIKVPPPTFCPECRLIRRLTFRNERNLYRRPCDLCRQEKILMYPKDSPFSAYCKECWWSDKWDARSYGREYDFSKNFFEQFRDLLRSVPRVGIIQQGNNPGSEYANRVTDNRSCYLNFGSTVAEYCRYGSFINYSKECVDCNNITKCERCYWCVDCSGCYQLAFSRESHQCSDSWFLVNCRNVQNCFGCVNLRNKQYCIFNEQYTKEEYEKKLNELGAGTRSAMEAIKRQVEELVRKSVSPAIVTHKSTGSSGNWIEESKNAIHSFGCHNTEEVKYCVSIFSEKAAMDHCFWGNGSELMYETISAGIQCGSIRFSNECWSQNLDFEYCMNCHGSRHLFGCVGLRNAEYCILNKQYSKEEYEALVPKIIEAMSSIPYADSKGRIYKYGEFFPPELSPFAYNETLAQEFFPLDRGAAAERGYGWKEPEARSYSVARYADQLPDRAADAPDTLADEVIGCMHKGTCTDQCTTAFRILKEDLVMYKNASIPLPLLCPNCRHAERLRHRNPLRLWPRKCQCAGARSENGVVANTNAAHLSHPKDARCPNEFETSYAPNRPEIIYCEACYNTEVA